MMSRYINPYTDFGFKKLFGEEGNSDLLIDFLNQLLPKHHQIKDLTFQNVENLPDTAAERKAFFDIHCTAHSGEHFIVEMQKAKVKYFKDRALFYTTFPIRDQAKSGADWGFQLSAIYFVAILDFFYDENEERAKFYRDVQLKDQDCEVFYDKLHFKFLQMPAFKKEEKDLVTKFDKWAYFLKHLSNFEKIPQILNEPIFEKAFQASEVANFSIKQRDEYEKSRLSYFEVKAVFDTAMEEGWQEGRKEGIKEGIKEGLEKGIRKGLIEAATSMKKDGASIDFIVKHTGLSKEEIENL
ncbi:MAG: Rpn family recombination-promoting nuclease/putative transposase [Bacteroidia bacterium]